MPEGAEGPQSPQPEPRGTPASKIVIEDLGGALPEKPSSEDNSKEPRQEAVQQNTERSQDERLASGRKEFGENVEQLTKNLAELGNSGVEPGQGGPATQEKWAKLKEFFKSNDGKTLIYATGVWTAAAGLTVVADYWTDGQVSTFTKVAGPGGVAFLTALGVREMALTMKQEIKQAANKGWEKIRKVTRSGNQEPSAGENRSAQKPVIEDLGGSVPEQPKMK